MRYDVVIVGYKLNANIKPAQALQNVLGIDLETAKAMTRQFPAPVLTGLSLSRAESVSQQLTEFGAKVEVRESRISHVSEQDKSPSMRPFPADEESGNYAIGEILAPMGRHSAARSSEQASSSRRPSREELDAALRESLRPDAGPPPPARISISPEHDAAFAGMSNFESIDGYTDSAAALDVDEVAFRSIQREPLPATKRPRTGPSFWDRVQSWARNLGSGLLEWTTGLLWLGLITAVTLVAVGYALNPGDIAGALKQELSRPSAP